MAKGKTPGWAVFPIGAAISLALYLVLQCLLALLTVKAVLPESAAFRFQIVFAAAAALCGGLYAAGKGAAPGTLWAALLTTAIFAAALVLGGLLFYDALAWTPETIGLLLAAAAGGLLAGLLGGRRRAGKQKKKPAAVGKRRGKER